MATVAESTPGDPSGLAPASSRQDSAMVQIGARGELCRLRRRLRGGGRLAAVPGEREGGGKSTNEHVTTNFGSLS